MAEKATKYILQCVKCGAYAFPNLIIRKSGLYPLMGIEIECKCKGTHRKVVYDIGHLQSKIQMNFNIIEKD